MYVYIYIYISQSSMKGYVKLSGSCSAAAIEAWIPSGRIQTSHLPLLNSIPTQPTTCKRWRPPKGSELGSVFNEKRGGLNALGLAIAKILDACPATRRTAVHGCSSGSFEGPLRVTLRLVTLRRILWRMIFWVPLELHSFTKI